MKGFLLISVKDFLQRIFNHSIRNHSWQQIRVCNDIYHVICALIYFYGTARTDSFIQKAQFIYRLRMEQICFSVSELLSNKILFHTLKEDLNLNTAFKSQIDYFSVHTKF